MEINNQDAQGRFLPGTDTLENTKQRPILFDFTEPATKAGAGVHLKNLYNDYVYFWRWALWRLFEQQNCGGVVTFITASSYLAGPGFVGVREVMRRTFDELWIIDLGGDNLGTRKTPNVFNIQTPVAIAIGVRQSNPSPDTPAKVHYAKIKGATREDKLTQLEAVANFGELVWHDCPDDWHKPFLPKGKGDYFDWLTLDTIFPWRHSGAQFKRSWPIAETEELLGRRLERLYAASSKERGSLFVETASNNLKAKGVGKKGGRLINPTLDLFEKRAFPKPEPYAFRALDVQRAIISSRTADRIRPELVDIRGEDQIYLSTLFTQPLGMGSGMQVAAHLPDLHHFRGSFGGKDVIPLYRDAAGSEPNITGGLLDALGKEYGTTPKAEDVAAYVYALLGGQSYTRRFWNELETPGPRVPLTKDGATFAAAVTLGRKLIWLHTYAERFRGDGRGNDVPPGTAKIIKGVSDNPAKYPEAFSYDPGTAEITVGDGRFGPVVPEVWEFEVSGLKVVQSWLGYRMKRRAGKKSSPLDEIRPERWTPRMSDDLLELLWVLESTLAMEPNLENVLDRAVAGPCFTAAELPTPKPEECQAPGKVSAAGGLLEMMGVEDDSDDDDEQDD